MLAFDSLAQRPFFSEAGWLFDRAFHKAHKALLYTGPKGLLIGLAVLTLIAAVLVCRRGKDLENARQWRNALLLLALSIALVPLLNATIKKLTGVYSPVVLIPYGGAHEHIGFLEHIRRYGGWATGRAFRPGTPAAVSP